MSLFPDYFGSYREIFDILLINSFDIQHIFTFAKLNKYYNELVYKHFPTKLIDDYSQEHGYDDVIMCAIEKGWFDLALKYINTDPDQLSKAIIICLANNEPFFAEKMLLTQKYKEIVIKIILERAYEIMELCCAYDLNKSINFIYKHCRGRIKFEKDSYIYFACILRYIGSKISINTYAFICSHYKLQYGKKIKTNKNICIEYNREYRKKGQDYDDYYDTEIFLSIRQILLNKIGKIHNDHIHSYFDWLFNWNLVRYRFPDNR